MKKVSPGIAHGRSWAWLNILVSNAYPEYPALPHSAQVLELSLEDFAALFTLPL